jgi:hypothetical protein
LAVREEAPKPSEEPVDFVTDPNGKSFGSGVVARGGTAEVGAPAARPGGEGIANEVGTDWAKESDLRRRPRLAEADACRGFYPRLARADRGVAMLSVKVRSSGEVAKASLVSENPVGEGFGDAAMDCVAGKVFEPGIDRRGHPANAIASLLIRFSR